MKRYALLTVMLSSWAWGQSGNCTKGCVEFPIGSNWQKSCEKYGRPPIELTAPAEPKAGDCYRVTSGLELEKIDCPVEPETTGCLDCRYSGAPGDSHALTIETLNARCGECASPASQFDTRPSEPEDMPAIIPGCKKGDDECGPGGDGNEFVVLEAYIKEDVPAIWVKGKMGWVKQGTCSIGSSVGDGPAYYTPGMPCCHMEDSSKFECADKSRILLHSEDGKAWCHRVQP